MAGKQAKILTRRRWSWRYAERGVVATRGVTGC
jgi:hypothetical protein